MVIHSRQAITDIDVEMDNFPPVGHPTKTQSCLHWYRIFYCRPHPRSGMGRGGACTLRYCVRDAQRTLFSGPNTSKKRFHP